MTDQYPAVIDEDTDWLTFADTVCFLRSPVSAVEGMVTIYHKRESYVEDLFEGVVLVPGRRVAAELQVLGFRFVPHEYRRRLVKHSGYHFLGKPIRTFASLTCQSRRIYTDANGKPSAERSESSCPYEREIRITLRHDHLANYCARFGLVAIWVTDSSRFSERPVESVALPAKRGQVAGHSYRYLLSAIPNPRTQYRCRMRTRSMIHGKRVLFS